MPLSQVLSFLLQPPEQLCFSPSSVLPGPERSQSYPFPLRRRARLAEAVLVSGLLRAQLPVLFWLKTFLFWRNVASFPSPFHDSSKAIILSETLHILLKLASGFNFIRVRRRLRGNHHGCGSPLNGNHHEVLVKAG